jgi:uncharacterized integral membrane protein (TIGR00697 family)
MYNIFDNKKNLYLLYLICVYVSMLVCANIASNKLTLFFNHTIDAGFFFFPITYVVNDVITEIYGFNTTRKVVLFGFIVNFLVLAGIIFTINMPVAPEYEFQQSLENVFYLSLRIFVASCASYFVGENLNSFIVEKLKEIYNKQYRAVRFFSSTVIAAFFENTIFYFLCFYGELPIDTIISMMIIQYIMKIMLALCFLPISCNLVDTLNKHSV